MPNAQSKSKKDRDAARATPNDKLTGQAYERELSRLHAELVKLQLWVVAKGLKVCVIFEGRDGAGKGGVIKAITERVSPRVFRVVALPAPTEREKSQMYIQNYPQRIRAQWSAESLFSRGIAPSPSVRSSMRAHDVAVACFPIASQKRD